MTDGALDRIYRALPEDVVLVGGQALAFWMLRYVLATGADSVTWVTSDLDVLGKVKDAEELNKVLGGRLILPAPIERTALVARLMLPASDAPGAAHKVEVIHQLYDVGGQRKSAEFTARAANRAVTVTLGKDFKVKVLHPLDVLASRVNNAAGLVAQKGDHVITQAAWAVDVMRQAFLRLAYAQDGNAQGRVGAWIQEVRGLANSSAGRSVRHLHGIEVMDAVPEAELVQVLPALKRQFDALHRSAKAIKHFTGKGSGEPAPAGRPKK